LIRATSLNAQVVPSCGGHELRDIGGPIEAEQEERLGRDPT
jgi:hypothetical protein